MNIKDLLKLRKVPRKIGAVDISNISGSEAVGAIIMYEDGKFLKDEYRLFKIKTVKGIDDFAMIGEVIRRYMQNISGDEDRLPGLMLIDGGKGQLRAALEAMKQCEGPVECAAIAKARDTASTGRPGIQKEMERVYLPGRGEPVYLDPFHYSTHLLQKIRDEVHRFAVSYHKKLRTKRTLASPLENIPGIGKARRLLLLKRYGSIDAIKKAPEDEIASMKGMNKRVAEELKKGLI